jgi:hypothetical protein
MTMQADRRYAFSFITGALFVPETVAVAELLAAGKDWSTIRESVPMRICSSSKPLAAGFASFHKYLM